MTYRNWLITGGCGFIGRTLIELLVRENLANSIRVVDNLCESERSDLSHIGDFTETEFEDLAPMGNLAGVEFVMSDIRNLNEAIECSIGADVVVHLAANTGVQPSILSPIKDMESNVIGSLNYLEASRLAGVSKFIFASSGAPIGEAEPPIHENLPCRPISPYGASKLAGEAYCSAYHGSYGLNTVVLRFSNVYGPMSGRKGSVVAKFIKQAFDKVDWVVNGGGEQTRDFVYSQDLVNAIICAAQPGIGGGEVFQIATQEETSISCLVEILGRILEREFGLKQKTVIGEELTGDVARNFADISHSRNVLGWTPTTILERGLEHTASWFGKEFKTRV